MGTIKPQITPHSVLTTDREVSHVVTRSLRTQFGCIEIFPHRTIGAGIWKIGTHSLLLTAQITICHWKANAIGTLNLEGIQFRDVAGQALHTIAEGCWNTANVLVQDGIAGPISAPTIQIWYQTLRTVTGGHHGTRFYPVAALVSIFDGIAHRPGTVKLFGIQLQDVAVNTNTQRSAGGALDVEGSIDVLQEVPM